jgi:hypothetical protein
MRARSKKAWAPVTNPPPPPGNVAFTSPNAGANVAGMVTLKGTLAAPASLVEVKVDSDAYRVANRRANGIDWACAYNMETLSVGSHTFTVRATIGGVQYTATRDFSVSSVGIIPGLQLDRWNNIAEPTNKNKYSTINTDIGTVNGANGLPGRIGHYRDLKSVQTTYDRALPLAECRQKGWLCHTVSSGGTAEYINSASDGSSRLLNFTIQEALNRWVDYTLNDLLGTKPWVKAIIIDNSHPSSFYNGYTYASGNYYPYEIPNYTAWRTAFAAAYKFICQALLDAGFYVTLNITGNMGFLPGWSGSGTLNDFNQSDKDWWAEIAPYCDCINFESIYGDNSGGNKMRVAGNAPYPAVWDLARTMHPFANSLGVDFTTSDNYAIMGGDSTPSGQGLVYGKCSWLMDWNGQTGGYKGEVYDNSGDPFNNIPNFQQDFGKPTGPATQPLGTGTVQNSRVWKRVGTLRTAYVNTNQYGEVNMVVDGHSMPSPSGLIV